VTGSISTLSAPWVFSQSHPLSTTEVISEAKRRGAVLDPAILRELYHRGDLAPMVEITVRGVREPLSLASGPVRRGTMQLELHRAMTEGRLRDPHAHGYRSRLRFDSGRLSDPEGWWNGLLYSQWQLLSLPDLQMRLMRSRALGPAQQRRIVLPVLEEWSRPIFEGHRRWALVLSVLEARYLPTVDPEWLSLSNTDLGEWQSFREDYDPIAAAQSLGVAGEEVRDQAERLLLRARNLDPTGDWARLIGRAPRRSWKTLRGDALLALDHRVAAEILLQFHDDLVAARYVAPLLDLPTVVGHLHCARLSAGRGEPIDRVLGHLGVSPHPGVVLAVEGETEELLVPRVFDHLGLRRSPDLVRILCIRGADKQLPLVAAATVAPLLGERRAEGYEMIRPPTRLVIAVDRDHRWNTDARVARERRKIFDEIKKVIAAQGGRVSPGDLDTLVEVHRWPARCFEYAHFSPEELAMAMRTIHHDCGGLDQSTLAARITAVRERGDDIKKVWDATWTPKPTKPELAEALWPALRAKLDVAMRSDSGEIPPVAEVVARAYRLAQQSNYGTYIIGADDGHLASREERHGEL